MLMHLLGFTITLKNVLLKKVRENDTKSLNFLNTVHRLLNLL